MKSKFQFLVLSLITVGQTTAYASFDLVAVLDKTNRKIHRFDGDTGVYLGSINDIGLQATAISLDSATGNIFVAEGGNGFSIYNIHTGNIVTSNFNPSPTISSYGLTNNLLFGDGNIIWNYGGGTDSGSIWTTLANGSVGATSINAIVREGSVMYVLDNINKRIAAVNINSPGSITYNTGAFNAALGNRMMKVGNRFYYTNSAGSILYTSTSGSPLTSTASLATSVGGGLAFTAFKGMATAHTNDQYLVGTTASGQQVMRSFNSGTTTLFSRKVYTIPGLGTADDVAVMIAPEPGSMAVLGLGILGLMKKRRVASASSKNLQ